MLKLILGKQIFCIGVLTMNDKYTVTVWHYDEESDIPIRKTYIGMVENSAKKITKNGIKQKGFYFGDSMSVRIFTDDEINITPGDYICCGEYIYTYPDRNNSQKIVEVRDNRRGGNPHWRILCGG